MAEVAVLGELVKVQGFALAGAVTCPAEDPAAVRDAWASLPADVVVVILTPRAAQALDDRDGATWPLTVVMPP